MWLARETGCRLIGVDFSEVAVADASGRPVEFGVEGRAEFRVGELEAIGLPDSSVDAVVCVDAVQFAADATAVAAELRRVLRPGGVAVLTTWETLDRDDPEVPERIRRLDLAAALPAGGLVDVEVRDKPEWLETERQLWAHIMGLDAGDDQGLQDAQEEAAMVSTKLLPRSRRVLASGRAPA